MSILYILILICISFWYVLCWFVVLSIVFISIYFVFCLGRVLLFVGSISEVLTLSANGPGKYISRFVE